MERQPRDMVFCHECENEWFRDEHGLTCPDCHSDFTEIIEAQHDPRQALGDMEQENPLHPLHGHDPWAHTPHDAPDPDEGDIQNFHWHNHQPGGIQMSFSHTFDARRRNPTDPQPLDPMMQNFAQMLNTLVSAGGRQPMAQDPTQQQHHHHQDPPQQGQEPGVHVFHGGGPAFHYTATARLRPRDANGPQPPPQVMEDLPNLLQSVFQGPARGPGPDPAFAPMGPFAGLFANLFNPANMQVGDAVYSQEALDRIVSQLMEQNQQGNAPGPASPEAIASLPQKTISKEDLDETTAKADCSICMDEAPIGTTVISLPCGHWFHGECIKAWLSEHDTCPHCRQGIMPKDGPENAANARSPGETPRHDHNWTSGQGTQNSPFTVPESPSRQRRFSNSGGNGGLFSRMRDAFGGGGGAAGTGTGNNNANNNNGGDDAGSAQ